MMNGNELATLTAKLDGIADLINEKMRAADERAEKRFESVEEKVDELARKVVTTDICQYKHDITAAETKLLIPRVDDHEKRMVRLERGQWLLAFVSGGLSTVFLSALSWFVIQLLSGNIL